MVKYSLGISKYVHTELDLTYAQFSKQMGGAIRFPVQPISLDSQKDQSILKARWGERFSFNLYAIFSLTCTHYSCDEDL